jgi:hypothetical protein
LPGVSSKSVQRTSIASACARFSAAAWKLFRAICSRADFSSQTACCFGLLGVERPPRLIGPPLIFWMSARTCRGLSSSAANGARNASAWVAYCRACSICPTFSAALAAPTSATAWSRAEPAGACAPGTIAADVPGGVAGADISLAYWSSVCCSWAERRSRKSDAALRYGPASAERPSLYSLTTART